MPKSSTYSQKLTLAFLYDALVKMGEVNVEDNAEDNAEVSDQVKKLLSYLSEKTLSAKEIRVGLGLNSDETLRKHYLTPAIEAGLIERTRPDKPTSRNQKYRLVYRESR